MSQVLETGLAVEDLTGMANKARESLNRPGVAVEIPRSMVFRIESALEGRITEQLLVLREQGRTLTSESLELRIR